MDDPERLSHLSVLLLDDDYQVVAGIARVIRRRHPGWTVHEALAITDAMRILDAHGVSIDVAVCDIRLPHLPGTSLLGLIREMFPWIIRITLSGMLDPESLAGAERNAEAHFCKPLPAERLCDAIIRLCRERPWSGERIPRKTD